MALLLLSLPSKAQEAVQASTLDQEEIAPIMQDFPSIMDIDEHAVEQKQLPELGTLETVDEDRVLRIGLVAERGPTYLQIRVEPFRRYMQETLMRPVDIIPFMTMQALRQAHVSRQVDYAIYPASTFAMTYASCGCLLPLVSPIAQNAADRIYNIAVVLQDSPIRNLAGLAGHSLALSSRKDAIPYHMALNELRYSGFHPEKDIAEIVVRDTPSQALQLLQDGKVDAAMVWSMSAYNQDLLNEPGAVAAFWQQKKKNAKKRQPEPPQFRAIWQSRPVPLSVHAIHKDISKQDRADIVSALTSMNKDAPDAYDSIERNYGAGFEAVQLDDFAPLLEIATAK